MVVIAILEAVNPPFLENYSKTAGIISSSRDNLAITEGLNLITSVRKKNLSTRISYNSIKKWRQTNCPSLAGLHVGFSCLFTNYAFIYKSTKKNVSREATSEKERNRSRKSTIMPSFISLAISRGKQGGFFLLSSGKRFFGDHKSGTSSATFSVVVLQRLKKILKYRYLIWGVF